MQIDTAHFMALSPNIRIKTLRPWMHEDICLHANVPQLHEMVAYETQWWVESGIYGGRQPKGSRHRARAYENWTHEEQYPPVPWDEEIDFILSVGAKDLRKPERDRLRKLRIKAEREARDAARVPDLPLVEIVEIEVAKVEAEEAEAAEELADSLVEITEAEIAKAEADYRHMLYQREYRQYAKLRREEAREVEAWEREVKNKLFVQWMVKLAEELDGELDGATRHESETSDADR